jgi:glucose/mannose-6-phosphate isomerase
VSYSGNTAETMNLFEQLRRRRCVIVSVTSGGKLAEASEKRRIPVVRVEPGRLPRAALPSLVTSVIMVMHEAGQSRALKRALNDCARVLSLVTVRYDSVQPSEKNEAKIFATQLFGRWIHVLALERDQSLARRFVAELNENSKLPASYSFVPEFAHNMIEGWPFYGPERLPLALVAFRGKSESPFERRLYSEAVMVVAERANATVLEFTPRSVGRLSGLMESIAFGDWVSYYLAILRGVDPSEMPAITEYKRRIARVAG